MTDHVPLSELNVSPAQVENLRKLSAYLAGLPTSYDHFGMTMFAAGVGYDASNDQVQMEAVENIEHHCGAVACAVGHGPAAGIAVDPSDEYWSDYSDRVFGFFELADATVDQSVKIQAAWRWCFSCAWAPIDDTPAGAALRINYILEKGLPGAFKQPRAHWLEIYQPQPVAA